MERIVVAGAGLGGLRSVEALRRRGYTGRVTVIGAERHLPYDRPPLSKAVLSGKVDDTTLEADWDEPDVELLLGRRVIGLRDGVVETDAGSLDLDGLVIATGASPVRLTGGPYRVLRTIDDALALRAVLRPGLRLAIVGAGWIGAEAATAAAAAGCAVTVVEAAPAPLATAVGPEVGARTVRWYRESGIDLRLNVGVEAIEPGGLTLSDGDPLPADEVLVAVGVRPEVGWLAGSGLALDDGVVVDEKLAARPGVVAVGDCAAWWSPRFGCRLRVEHWDTALNSPETAAATLLGADDAYDPVPYFWSEQHGRMLQYAGYHSVGEELIWRGDPDGDQWTACWLREGVLVGILTVDRPRDLLQGRRLIGAGGPVDRDRLADPSIPVRDAAR
ncbi:MAG: NAD(P)/FAD-dependent oxidoreductase [Streptosporangiales bacterium]|nr:NAD(P)/FAD-dependent oxidoreductase [Streptosporangiales bacterium]